MKPNKKAQMALEHMSTYAFAFLIILLMVGALAYLGVLSPKKVITDTCVINVEFKCEDAVIHTNEVLIKVKNNLDEVTIMNVTITDRDSNSKNFNDTRVNMKGGQTNIFSINKPAGADWTSREKKKLDIKIVYKNKASDDTFTKIIGGELLGTVQ